MGAGLEENLIEYTEKQSKHSRRSSTDAGSEKKSKKDKKKSRRSSDVQEIPVALQATIEPMDSEIAPQDSTASGKSKASTKSKKREAQQAEARAAKEKDNKVLINGQQHDMGAIEQQKVQAMDSNRWQLAKQELCLIKVMKKSARWSKYVTRVEINEDPIGILTKPIVKVDMKLRTEQVEKAMMRMTNQLIRACTYDPPNEGRLTSLRMRLEDLWFRLRKCSELEADFEPIFHQTLQGLVKTQQRLDQLQMGMGYSASEPSVSSDCQEAAMDKLKNTRKQMQYTIASIHGGGV